MDSDGDDNNASYGQKHRQQRRQQPVSCTVRDGAMRLATHYNMKGGASYSGANGTCLRQHRPRHKQQATVNASTTPSCNQSDNHQNDTRSSSSVSVHYHQHPAQHFRLQWPHFPSQTWLVSPLYCGPTSRPTQPTHHQHTAKPAANPVTWTGRNSGSLSSLSSIGSSGCDGGSSRASVGSGGSDSSSGDSRLKTTITAPAAGGNGGGCPRLDTCGAALQVKASMFGSHSLGSGPLVKDYYNCSRQPPCQDYGLVWSPLQSDLHCDEPDRDTLRQQQGCTHSGRALCLSAEGNRQEHTPNQVVSNTRQSGLPPSFQAALPPTNAHPLHLLQSAAAVAAVALPSAQETVYYTGNSCQSTQFGYTFPSLQYTNNNNSLTEQHQPDTGEHHHHHHHLHYNYLPLSGAPGSCAHAYQHYRPAAAVAHLMAGLPWYTDLSSGVQANATLVSCDVRDAGDAVAGQGCTLGWCAPPNHVLTNKLLSNLVCGFFQS